MVQGILIDCDTKTVKRVYDYDINMIFMGSQIYTQLSSHTTFVDDICSVRVSTGVYTDIDVVQGENGCRIPSIFGNQTVFGKILLTKSVTFTCEDDTTMTMHVSYTDMPCDIEFRKI